MLVYDSTLRVPLIIAAPGRAPETRDDAVSLADLAPTLLRAAGVAPPVEMKGRDLLGGPGARVPGARVPGAANADLYSEAEYPRVAGWSPLQALTDGRWMTIRAGTSTEVYDLRRRGRRTTSRRLKARWRRDGGAPARSCERRCGAAIRFLGGAGRLRSAATSPAPCGRAGRRAESASRIAVERLRGRARGAQRRARRHCRCCGACRPQAPTLSDSDRMRGALQDGRQIEDALAVYRQAAALANDNHPPRSRGRRAGRGQRGPRRAEACAAGAARGTGGAGAPAGQRRRSTAPACWRSTKATRRTRRRRSSGRRPPTPTTRRTGRTSATRGARSPIAPARSRRTAARSRSTRGPPTRPTGSASCRSKPTGPPRRRPGSSAPSPPHQTWSKRA